MSIWKCTCKLHRAFDRRNICDPEANGTIDVTFTDVTFTPSGRSCNSSRRLECELIAETRYCSEVDRTVWIVLQLVPEFHNVIIDAAVSGVPVSIAANSLQQLGACDDAIGIFNEKLQRLELMCRQRD